MRVNIAIEYSKKAKPLRRIVGFSWPLLIDAMRATITAPIDIAMGTVHVTADQF